MMIQLDSGISSGRTPWGLGSREDSFTTLLKRACDPSCLVSCLCLRCCVSGGGPQFLHSWSLPLRMVTLSPVFMGHLSNMQSPDACWLCPLSPTRDHVLLMDAYGPEPSFVVYIASYSISGVSHRDLFTQGIGLSRTTFPRTACHLNRL